MTIAVVAAQPEELAPLARRLAGRRPAPVGRWFGCESQGVDLRMMVAGDGAQQAGEAVRRLLAVEAPAVLIGFGAAGGLTPDLSVCDVLVAREVVEECSGRTYRPPESSWLERGRGRAAVRSGTVFTARAIAADPVAKGRLARYVTAPAVVDLESAAWASVASRAQIPFVLARAVSDAWDEALPLDFEGLSDGRGSIDRRRVLLAAALRPSTWPSLVRLRRRMAWIGEALADWVIEVVAT